jgi:hypothetical protein
VSDHKGIGIDSMLDMLDIGEDEFDDFVLEEDVEEIKASTMWLAVARVHCPKTFSHEAFFQQMRLAWNPAREISMRAVAANRFVIQCFCLGDWEKVMERGPWLFRDWMVVIAPYDGFSDPGGVELELLPIWLQVHKIPEGYRKQKMVEKLVGRVAGEVMFVEMSPAGSFRGDFVRVRVKHDVRLPLTRWVSIILDGKRSLYMVKYEKLGLFCNACGLVGHVYKECGNGIFEEKQLKFGEWLHAYPSGRGRSSLGRGGMRGGNSVFGTPARGEEQQGRGMGRGRGSFVDWRSHPERRVPGKDGELKNTASNPIKSGDVVMAETETEMAARKRLAFQDTLDNTSTSALNNTKTQKVDGTEPTDSGGSSDSKRHKRNNGMEPSGTRTGSAASFEDDRRDQ